MALTVDQRREIDARLQRRPPGARLRPVPRQRLPWEAVAQLGRVHLALVDALERITRRELAPFLAELPREDGGDARFDQADPREAIRSILRVFGEVAESDRVQAGISRVGRVVDRVVSGQVRRQFEYVLGVTPQEDPRGIGNRIDVFTNRNVNLIRSVAREQLGKVEGLVRDAQRTGRNVRELADDIARRFDVTRSRGRLIARDQVAKLNSQLTIDRHRANGVDRYRWRNSGDERVRGNPSGKWPDGLHWGLEGTIHTYDDPPIVDARSGRRAHPGDDIQCRCTPEPVFEDVVEEVERNPPPDDEPPPGSYVVNGRDATDDAARRLLDEAADVSALGTTEEARGDAFLGIVADAFRPTSKLTAKKAGELRTNARRMIQGVWPELRSRDAGLAQPGALKLKKVAAWGRSTHDWYGEVQIGRAHLAELQDPRRRARGVWTLIHEEMHGYSPITPEAYRGPIGKGIEEGLTELMARRVIRRGRALQVEGVRNPNAVAHGHFAHTLKFEGGRWTDGTVFRDNRSHVYDYYLQAMIRATQRAIGEEVTGKASSAAVDILERAGASIRSGRHRLIVDADEHLDALTDAVKRVASLTDEQAAGFRADLVETLPAAQARIRELTR